MAHPVKIRFSGLMKKNVQIWLAFMLLPVLSTGQELNIYEQELYQLLMTYRAAYGLPQIPISGKLNQVAQAHVEDLEANGESWPSQCNLHS